MAVSESIVQSRRALYVGGLGDDVSQTTLRAAMIPFGPIKSIDIVRKSVMLARCCVVLLLLTIIPLYFVQAQPMDYQKGIHKGFAFVEYEDPEVSIEGMK